MGYGSKARGMGPTAGSLLRQACQRKLARLALGGGPRSKTRPSWSHWLWPYSTSSVQDAHWFARGIRAGSGVPGAPGSWSQSRSRNHLLLRILRNSWGGGLFCERSLPTLSPFFRSLEHLPCCAGDPSTAGLINRFVPPLL